MCKKDGGIVMANFAVLRVAVFPLSAKTLKGVDIHPPPSVRGLTYTFPTNLSCYFQPSPICNNQKCSQDMIQECSVDNFTVDGNRWTSTTNASRVKITYADLFRCASFFDGWAASGVGCAATSDMVEVPLDLCNDISLILAQAEG